jgi:hypothetical protein
MKSSLQFTAFIMLLTLLSNLSCNNVQKPKNIEPQKNSETKDLNHNKQILSMINDFYTNWITESSKSFVNIDEQKLIISKYCSMHLIKLLDSLKKERLLDYDPFMNSQIVMLDCLRTLEVRKDSLKNNVYHISYHLPNSDNELVTVEIFITQEKGTFKIDSLLGLNHN